MLFGGLVILSATAKLFYQGCVMYQCYISDVMITLKIKYIYIDKNTIFF